MLKLKNLLLFVTLALPKAGAKIGGFPLYLSLLSNLFFIFSGVAYILRRKSELLFILTPLMFFIILFLFNQLPFTGYQYYGSASLETTAIIAYIISFFSYLCFYGALNVKGVESWKKNISYVFYVIVIYAIMQKVFGDYTVVIPGITANYQDATTPDFLSAKNNMIWGIGYLKATSTYQNGNLFGANLLLIGFTVIANKRISNQKMLVPLSLLCIVVLLTASVSIYLGLSVGLIWMLFTSKGRSGNSIIFFIFGLLLISAVLLVVFTTDNIFSEIARERLFNRDLSQGSGRTEKIIEYFSTVSDNFWVLINGMLLFDRTFHEVYEVLPIAILQILGLPLLAFFILFVTSKLRVIFKTPYIIPFVAYFSASLSDGAFWLPPTAANLFILMGLCTAWHQKERLT